VEIALRAVIEPLVREQLEGSGAPGASIAVTIDGAPRTAAFGYADLERTQPLEPEARFPMYSITKTVIAALVMRLVEDGVFGLDDPIQAYVPDVPYDTALPIRRLLNHTSGLPSYGTTPEYQEAVRVSPGTPWSDAEFVRRTCGSPLLFTPGRGWRYSNIGYLYLRQLLEVETGMTYRQVVRTVLGSQLGLRQLDVASDLTAMQSLTAGFSTSLGEDGIMANVIPHYHPGWVAHGLVTGPAAEFAAFLELLMTGRIVEPPLLTEMLEGALVKQAHPWMTDPAYGLGLMIDLRHPFGRVAGHTGGGPGFSTAAYHFPDVAGHRLTVVSLVNADRDDAATAIAFSIANHLAGTPHVMTAADSAPA
jgi:D-alanyl-D-alanine carboxypeptidase